MQTEQRQLALLQSGPRQRTLCRRQRKPAAAEAGGGAAFTAPRSRFRRGCPGRAAGWARCAATGGKGSERGTEGEHIVTLQATPGERTRGLGGLQHPPTQPTDVHPLTHPPTNIHPPAHPSNTHPPIYDPLTHPPIHPPTHPPSQPTSPRSHHSPTHLRAVCQRQVVAKVGDGVVVGVHLLGGVPVLACTSSRNVRWRSCGLSVN